MPDRETLVLDGHVYRMAAIKKAAYRVAANCTAMIESASDHRIVVAFAYQPGTTEAHRHEAVRSFYEELLDQELREQVSEETAPLRTLILAQAFSRTDLIEHE